MIKSVELAVAALTSLSERDQDRMGRQLLTYIERLLQLRTEIDKGSGPFAPGEAETLDIDDFLHRQHDRHGGA